VPESDAMVMEPHSFEEHDAFVGLCRQHGPAIHAYLARRTGRQGADDVFGEVWLQAYAARATYDGRLGTPLPWLYGIARNVLRTHWRGQQRAEAVLQQIDPDPWSEADDRLDAAARLDELRHALGQLTEAEREVLLLVAWERLTPAEVARALDIPQGTARSRLHRARLLKRGELATESVLLLTTNEETQP
jgi:RNA polymerase sigma factor (sigma-70 family)